MTGKQIIAGIGIVICLVAFIRCAGDNIPSAPKPTAAEISAKAVSNQLAIEDIEARSWAKIYVQNSLKSPSTASFPSTLDFYVAQVVNKKREILKGRWMVSGYVDAQNGFGAMIRNNWRVELKKIGDKWILLRVNIG